MLNCAFVPLTVLDPKAMVLFVKVTLALFLVASLVLSTLFMFKRVLTSAVDRSSILDPPPESLHTNVLFQIASGVGEPVPDCCTSIEWEGV